MTAPRTAAALVAHNLKRLRLDRGWTQEDLAEHADVHRVSLAKFEMATLAPRLATLDRLAAALGVPVGDLFR